MLIIPAIDIQGGQAVRLLKGDYAQKTVYNTDPTAVARGFLEMGAKFLHVVDLDGAKGGCTANVQTIRAIKAVGLPMQVGGGIRTAETVRLYLEDIGVNRVILGTAAVSNPNFVRQMLARYGPERIAAGVDVRDGRVSTSGWTSDSALGYLDFIRALKSDGVRYMVVTDISRDGTLTSPNWNMYRTIDESVGGLNFIVSGGVACEDDIKKAASYYGVIVGKAYYEGKVDLLQCFRLTT